MILLKNISQILTLSGVHQKDGRHLNLEDLSLISKGAIIFAGETIKWVGQECDLPANGIYDKVIDLDGMILTPELVDSHTHLVFAGDRAEEYAMKLNGVDYQEIAKSGGGILATMKATRQASPEELLTLARERIHKAIAQGIGTIEIKSGYGLDYHSEKKISEVIQKLKEEFTPRIQIINTYMAAHAVPKDFKTADEYLDQVVLPLMEELAKKKIIDIVDIFHEVGYFDKSHVERVFKKAISLNLGLKSHADEFNDNSGGELAANYKALSSDHLLCTGLHSIKALAQSSTVATLLPGTGFFLGKPQAPARALIDAGAKVAIASDYNPGSCHFHQLLFLAFLAAPHYKMNQAHTWAAITYNAAHALGLKDQGAIVPGFKARFSVFKAASVDHISYHWGENHAHPHELSKLLE